MVHVVEEAFYVGLDDITITFKLQVNLQAVNGLMGTFMRAVAIAAAQKILLPNALQNIGNTLLYDFIFQRWQAQWPLLSIAFGDIHTLYRIRPIPIGFELIG